MGYAATILPICPLRKLPYMITVISSSGSAANSEPPDKKKQGLGFTGPGLSYLKDCDQLVDALIGETVAKIDEVSFVIGDKIHSGRPPSDLHFIYNSF